MQKICITLPFITIIIVSLVWAAGKEFKGEVYKVNRYPNQVICRAPDLTMIDVGQKLYICNAKNKLVATVEITRYYTTVIETKILTGDINTIYVKMPVYTEKQYRAIKQKPINVIQYEKDYDYYWWDVNVLYEADGKKYTLS